MVFGLDPHPFLGLDCLMQTVGPPAARHQTSGELVDDEHLAIFDHVVDIELVERVCPQGLIHGVQRVHVRRLVELDAA